MNELFKKTLFSVIKTFFARRKQSTNTNVLATAISVYTCKTKDGKRKEGEKKI